MPQVTEKIYPIITGGNKREDVYTQSHDWYCEGSTFYQSPEKYITLTFDVSNVRHLESATICIVFGEDGDGVFTEAYKTKVGHLAKLQCSQLSIVESVGLEKYAYTKTLESTQINAIVNNTNITAKVFTEIRPHSGTTVTTTSKTWIGAVGSLTGLESDSYIEYTYIEPTISDFNITGTSIDENITCSWVQEDVNTWEVQALLNNKVVATKTGTTATTCTFDKGELTVGGEYTFKLIVKHGNVSVEESQTVTLSYTQASISLLEVPSTTINVDEAFTIRWVANNQSSFKLELDGKTYTGTTQTSVTIPKGTIGKGTKAVKLTVTYDSGYYSNSATTQSSFVGYGAPAKPSLQIKVTYNSATPSLAWISDEQVAYQVVIKHGLTVIEDSGQVVSANKYYIPTTVLENNATYTVSVKVRNKYGLWSSESTAQFTIQFIVPNMPTVQAIADVTSGSIILNVYTDTTNDTEYKNTEIWKREINGNWKRMAYKLNASDVWQDFYVGGNINYQYKARNVGQNGGIIESEVITARTVVNGYNFYDVEDNSNFLRFTCGDAPTPKINQSIVSNLFAGAEAPTNFSDGVLYWTCSLSFKTDNREDILKLVSLMRARLLLYKDNKGHKWFGNIINSPDFPEDDVEDITINIEFTQSQFTEEDVYCGDNLTLIRWNGGWKFDGTHVFGGE